MITVKQGTTSLSFYFNLVDSAAGTPKTGLTIANMDATYTRNRAAAVKNDLTALAAVTTAWTVNQAIEVDSVNAPGLYRIDYPDAAFAAGADKVTLSVTCAGTAPAHMLVELVANITADVVALLPAALVGGRIDASVGAMAANVMTAAAAAADLTTELQNGLATAAALATLDDFVDTEVAAIKAKTDNLPADPADASDIAASFATVNATLATLATQALLTTVAGYLDTEIAAIKARTDLIPASPAAVGSAMTLNAAGVDLILDDVVDGAYTLRQVLRLYASAMTAKCSGLGTATAVFRDISDTKDRITATVDADGNRSAVVLDPT